MENKKTLHPLNLLRLSLFQGCLGCLAVIFAGMLNRIMITELAFPALLVGGGLAFEQIVSPSRVLFGNISDSWPIKGRKRTPYILLGSAAFCLLAVLSIPIIFETEKALNQGSFSSITFSIISLCSLFALYGLAISMATTPYLALIIDLTQEKERSKAVGIIWCMLTIGIIVGAISISIATKNLDGITNTLLLQTTLQKFMINVSAIIFFIVLFACWGIEPKNKELSTKGKKSNNEVGLSMAWSLITSSKQIFIFFSFLIFYTLGLFLQDPILESFGAEVFNLPISKTTLLNAYWGIGTLIGLLLGGLIIIPRIGKFYSAKLGCWLIALSLGLLIISGSIQNNHLLFTVLFIFGISAGIATNSALSLMLDLTMPEVAGTFVGVWGLAQALSRAMGKVFGGGLLDIGRSFSNQANSLPAFSFVFSIEIIIILIAIVILDKVSVSKFRKETSTKMESLFMAELDN